MGRVRQLVRRVMRVFGFVPEPVLTHDQQMELLVAHMEAHLRSWKENEHE